MAWSNYAADEYVTSDGRKFSNHHDADNHEKMLAEKNKSSSGSSKPTVDWSTYNNQGIQCYNSKDYAKAIENYNTALGIILGDWNMATVLANRAAAYLALGDKDAAKINWSAAADIYFSLFDDDIFGGPAVNKYKEIQDNFTKIDYDNYNPETPPKSAKEVDAKVCVYKGNDFLYDFQDEGNVDYEKAIECFTQAINILPCYNNYISRGLAYQKNKNYEAAMADFNKAFNLLGDNNSEEAGRIYSCQAKVYEETGNIEAAIADYKKAADLKNEDNRFIDLKMLEKLGVQYTPKPFVPSKKSTSSSSVSSSSSSKSTSSDKGGVFMSLVFAFVCAIFISGMVSDSLNVIGIITLVVAAVIGFSAWRFKKTLLKLALIGLIILSFVLPRVNPSLLPKNWGTDFAVSANTVTVTSDALNMRAEPSGNAEVLQTLPNGTVLTVTGEAQNGWLPVTHNGSEGWVSSQYVE